MPPVFYKRTVPLLAIAAATTSVSAIACFDLSTPYHDALATNTYLVETVEPCAAPAGFDIDPCERRLDDWDEVQTPYNSGHTHRRERGPHTVETSVSLAFRTSYNIPHLIVRGTVLPGSTRCE